MIEKINDDGEEEEYNNSMDAISQIVDEIEEINESAYD